MGKKAWKKIAGFMFVFELFFIFGFGFMFEYAPLIWLMVTIISSLLGGITIALPIEIEKTIKKNIQEKIGHYFVINRLQGFSTTLSMSGELLVLSDDDTFYRVSIKRATIQNISSLDNHVVKTLI